MLGEPEFDWPQVASLLGEDPNHVPDDMAAIAVELINGAEERFQELKAKNAEAEKQAISALAHQLRGSLLNFGFSGVNTILLRIEKQVYISAEYPGLVDDSLAAFVASKKMLAERYPSLRFS